MTHVLADSTIYVHHYTLRSSAGLNAASPRREFPGVLIKVGSGYGNIHPWPERGDPKLDACLKDLQGARRWPIVKRALRCAELDGAARELGDWMFDEVEVPQSHATVTEFKAENVETAVAAGFQAVKMKVGRDLREESLALAQWSREYPHLKWRLDFNEKGEPGEVVDFVRRLGDGFRSRLDFLEDPCPFSPKVWKELHAMTRMNLAVDREAGPHVKDAQAMIIKPAVDHPWLLAEAAVNAGQALVFTSTMDHPLGQAFAAWEAMSAQVSFPGRIGLCGLQTHGAFRPTPFTEALGAVTPEFNAPEGTGLGFDDLLAELEWTPLD